MPSPGELGTHDVAVRIAQRGIFLVTSWILCQDGALPERFDVFPIGPDVFPGIGDAHVLELLVGIADQWIGQLRIQALLRLLRRDGGAWTVRSGHGPFTPQGRLGIDHGVRLGRRVIACMGGMYWRNLRHDGQQGK